MRDEDWCRLSLHRYVSWRLRLCLCCMSVLPINYTVCPRISEFWIVWCAVLVLFDRNLIVPWPSMFCSLGWTKYCVGCISAILLCRCCVRGWQVHCAISTTFCTTSAPCIIGLDAPWAVKRVCVASLIYDLRCLWSAVSIMCWLWPMADGKREIGRCLLRRKCLLNAIQANRKRQRIICSAYLCSSLLVFNFFFFFFCLEFKSLSNWLHARCSSELC